MESLVENLVAQAAARPEAPAYIDEHGTVSYGKLLERARHAAGWLRQRGVRPGDVVAVSVVGSSRMVRAGLYLFYGAGWLGAAILPFYPELTLEERRALRKRHGARWHFKTSELERLAPAESRPPPPRGDRAERPLLYDFSSGTTSEPKAMLFSHAQLAGNIGASAVADRWRPDDRVVSGKPWPSKVGLRYILRLHVAGGAYVCAPFPRNRDELASLIREHGVTGVCGAPVAMRELLRSRLREGDTLPPLRALRVSGAPSQVDQLRALRAEITANVYCSYGCTEIGLLASLPPEDPVSDPIAMRLISASIEAQVVDEHDVPLAPGAVGRLRYRAPWMVHEYAGDAAASAEHFRRGWFYPGDIGSLDAAGRITLRGRVGDVIHFNGVTIRPQEIEPVLLEHPEVADAALIGVPSAPGRQLPVAFVVPRGRTIDLEALRRYCQERCAEGHVPARFIATSKVRNAVGKVPHLELAARFKRLKRAQDAG